MTLADLGWNPFFEDAFAPHKKAGLVPARLLRDNNLTCGALLGDGDEFDAVISGKLYHDAVTDAELPAVGDWVALDIKGDECVIRARLPRRTCLSRKAPGRSTEEQVIAANVDVVTVVTDAGPDFSERRMERYFAIIGRSGAKAVVLVNKSDLFSASENKAAANTLRALAPDADIHITSAEQGRSLKVLRQYLKKGVTVALIGSSGVGKSSIVNQLLGDEYQWTDEVNEVTGKGRHTTTARELMLLPTGGILIDNPGIREVHMWTDETTLRNRFTDIAELAALCRFHDCKHGADAGCAIRTALSEGRLDSARFDGFLKLDDEIEELRRSRSKRRMTVERIARREQRERAKRFADRRQHDYEPEPR